MQLRLQRSSLIDQVCAALREGLQAGGWPEWLPGERRLCAELDERVGAFLNRTIEGDWPYLWVDVGADSILTTCAD